MSTSTKLLAAIQPCEEALNGCLKSRCLSQKGSLSLSALHPIKSTIKKAQDTNLPRTHTIRHRDHQRSHQRICHLDVFGLQTQLRLSSSAFSVSSYASVKIWFTLSLEIPKKSHYISDGIQLANISVYIYPGNFFTREKIR